MIEPRELGPLFEDGDVIDAALADAAVAARCEARTLRRPLVVWRDGRVVEIPWDLIPAEPSDTKPEVGVQ